MSGRSTGETAKCPLVRRVSDLGHTANTGAHDKYFLFSILNQSMEKKIRQNTTLPCARGMAHDEVKTSPCARSGAHGEVMSSPCARCQAHGEHGISIFNVNETCILLNFSISFSKFVLKLKTRP